VCVLCAPIELLPGLFKFKIFIMTIVFLFHYFWNFTWHYKKIDVQTFYKNIKRNEYQIYKAKKFKIV
jgi:hypothetical protein